MQILKLFSTDTEDAYRSRQPSGAGYVKGRGSYPENRARNSDRLLDNAFEDDWGLDYPNPGQSDQYESVRGVTRRRMPLTTLDALVQIKANGLAHG